MNEEERKFSRFWFVVLVLIVFAALLGAMILAPDRQRPLPERGRHTGHR